MWGNILETTSVIIAAWSVVIGITSWRSSLRGQRQFELAEHVAEGFGQAKAALAAIRSPVGFGGEGSTRKRSTNETEEDSKLLDDAYVAIERYRDHADTFNKLLALRYRFELYFGTQAATVFVDLNQILNDIILASRRLSRLWPRQGRVVMTEAEFEKHLKAMHDAEAVFWEGSEDPDPINVRIDAIMASVDRTCRSVISPKHTLCSTAKGWWSWSREFFLCRGKAA